MIKIFFLLLLIINIYAQDKKQEVTIGAGPYIQTQPYQGVSNILLPSPVIFFDNGLFYMRWSRGGIYFLGEKNDDYMWGFSLTAQPRTNEYKASDSKDLRGMKDKKSSIEAGLAFSAQVDKSYLEVMLLTDILDRYDSWIVKAELGHDFELGKFKFYPSLIAIYQSSDFINYYYGVDAEEAVTSSHSQYTPNSGIQLGAQTYIKYPLTKKLSGLINMRVDKLSSQATASPIVVDDYIYSGLVSLIYTFEY
ncbi:MAG: MipA/OmpV family protein [Sulfurimonas sp.]